jgi:hypothetical protein
MASGICAYAGKSRTPLRHTRRCSARARDRRTMTKPAGPVTGNAPVEAQGVTGDTHLRRSPVCACYILRALRRHIRQKASGPVVRAHVPACGGGPVGGGLLPPTPATMAGTAPLTEITGRLCRLWGGGGKFRAGAIMAPARGAIMPTSVSKRQPKGCVSNGDDPPNCGMRNIEHVFA